MKARPIMFNAPMVRALLDGTKTQTRRAVKLPHQNPLGKWEPTTFGGPAGGSLRNGRTAPEQGGIWHTRTGHLIGCPYGQPGDQLWVRETFAKIDGQTQPWIETDYRATYEHGARLGDSLGFKKRWTPAIHMPRVASRITLEVTGVRVERLHDISEADAIAEGLSRTASGSWLPGPCDHPEWAYHQLWDQINGPGSWDANPWVWVVEFKRVEASAC